MTYTVKDLQAKFRELGYSWPQFHLIGIRAKDYIENTFCDSFIVYNGGQVYRFWGTTRPGTYYLLNLLNPKGTAVLKPGQYRDTWKLGFHKQQQDHLAWVQAKPVTVYRDSDKDAIPEEVGPTDTGYFGIDIHRASKFTLSKLVDKYSAGCQVFANVENFTTFVELSKKSGLKTFTYTLLEEWTPSQQ